jgi:SOS-response transcriptional repressor LexA
MVIDGKVLMRIWDFIADYAARHGRAPSYREISEGVGHVSKSNVFRYLDILQDMGVLKREKAIHRSVRLVMVPARFDWDGFSVEWFKRQNPGLVKLVQEHAAELAEVFQQTEGSEDGE